VSSEYAVVAEAIRYVVDHRHTQPSLVEIAAHVHLSPGHLQRVFTRWAGVSPKRLLQFLNAAAARDLLAGSTVLDVSNAVGLSSQGRLHDACVQVHAATPGEVRRGGDGLVIRAGWAGSPFGDVFVATTDRGVCALAFAVEGADPEARLRADWPGAALVAADLSPLVERVFAPLEQRRAEPLSVIVKGTNLQVQVWTALLRIPEGATTSYARVAASIGRPSAVRAVANAIARNRVGWLVPCHRVLRENGTISGYAWGPERKRTMLAHERAGSFVDAAADADAAGAGEPATV
jgi:AraC family transcriptional regulator of adaptative response/methylated-DNA-[protein]-cysteine methyltransferase